MRTASPRFPLTGSAAGFKRFETTGAVATGAGTGATTGAINARATAVGMSSAPVTGSPLLA